VLYVDSGRPLCARTGHSPMVRRMRQFDPLLPFKNASERARRAGKRPVAKR
jgi:hypothetical protein